jgi:hypothetical protein
MTKEQVYMEQIAPLVSQILGICKENKIAHIMTFSVGTSAPEGEVLVTTAHLAEKCDPPAKLIEVIYSMNLYRPSPLVKMIDQDGSVQVKPVF